MSLLFGGRNRGVEQRAVNPIAAFGVGYDPNLGQRDPMSLVPLFAAHRVVNDAVASTPLKRYRDNSDGTRTELTPATLFLHTDGTQVSFVSQCVTSLLSDGNAFGYVTGFDYTGWPSSMVWLDPRKVQVEGGLDDPENPTAVARYYFNRRPLDPQRVLHITWYLPPGKNRGLSPLEKFKVAYETAQAAQAMARGFYANNGIPSVHVRNTDQTIDDPAVVDKLKTRYKDAVAGRDVLLTGSDWEVSVLGVPPDQANFIETLKLSATQIAAIYGVPPERIGGETGSSLTYKTLEQQEQHFYGSVVRPWATRIEEHLSTLLPRGQSVRFDLDAQVRADLLTRMQAHQIALQTGIETPDEARRAEDKPPLTPQQKAEWKDLYAKQSAPQPTPQPANTGDPKQGAS